MEAIRDAERREKFKKALIQALRSAVPGIRGLAASDSSDEDDVGDLNENGG